MGPSPLQSPPTSLGLQYLHGSRFRRTVITSNSGRAETNISLLVHSLFSVHGMLEPILQIVTRDFGLFMCEKSKNCSTRTTEGHHMASNPYISSLVGNSGSMRVCCNHYQRMNGIGCFGWLKRACCPLPRRLTTRSRQGQKKEQYRKAHQHDGIARTSSSHLGLVLSAKPSTPRKDFSSTRQGPCQYLLERLEHQASGGLYHSNFTQAFLQHQTKH